MKFQFTTLDYQQEAVAAVVDALREQPTFLDQPADESVFANRQMNLSLPTGR